MKLENIPYFVKFIFHLEENKCMSTTDSKMLERVIDKNTGKKIDGLYIGQKLQFEPIDENPKIYKVTDIKIRHLFDDISFHKYGIDIEDCVSPQGENKEWLFSVLITTKEID